MLSPLVLLALVYTATTGARAPAVVHCNAADRKIYAEKGHLFPSVFRAFGGLTVSKRAYEAAVVDSMGLSHACAECYGNAYLCGFDRCFWGCRSAGTTCDACLVKEGCIAAVNKCTGFSQ